MTDEIEKVSEPKDKRPKRPIIEKRLSEHVDALASAVSTIELSFRPLYLAHLETAKRILARWQGGESESALKASLEAELVLFFSESLPGKEAELVGGTFGELCRAVGIQTKLSDVPKHHFPFDPVDGLD